MIKKLILSLIFMFALPCMADHWVYIETKDKVGSTDYETANCAKKGDIIEILSCSEYTPSKIEKEKWKIIKVAGLSEIDINNLKKSKTKEINYIADTGKLVTSKEILSYRESSVDCSKIKIETVGIEDKVVEKNKLLDAFKEKTSLDFLHYKRKQLFYVLIQKPLLRLAHKIIPFARAATVSTIYNGGDYNTVALWEAATDNDLVTAGAGETGEMYNDGGDFAEENILIAGATTNATYYRILTAATAERHDGTAGTGVVWNPDAGLTANGYIVGIGENYGQVSWIEFTDWRTQDQYDYSSAVYVNGSISYTTVAHNIIHDPDPTDQYDYAQAIKITGATGDSKHYIYRNIIYEIDQYRNKGISTDDNDHEAYIYNNTLWDIGASNNRGIGIEVFNDAVVKNNIVIGTVGNCYNFNGTATHDYNASDDATATGANSLDSGDGTPPSSSDFVDVASPGFDLHIVSGAVEVDEGVDLGSPYDYDIDNVQIAGTWDIGADEYVAAGGASAAQFIMINQ